jgi:hypothetical protein
MNWVIKKLKIYCLEREIDDLYWMYIKDIIGWKEVKRKEKLFKDEIKKLKEL